jgi:hypothetical protein
MGKEDLIVLAKAMVAAFAAAAVVMMHCGRSWRAPRRVRVSAGAVLALGIGFYAGCWMIGPSLHWPPKEDRDRLLIVLFPAVLAVELEAAFARRGRPLVWLGRAAVVAGAARVLLHYSTYLSDLAGPGSAEWTPVVAALILGGLAAALAVVWALLDLLMRRAPGRAVPLALAVTCAGAAGAIMLSGYASGGMLGLPLAATLTGVVAGSLLLGRGADLRAALGPGIVGLFALLLSGHFFGELSVRHAVLLFLAPLLCWLPELPLVRRTWPMLRAVARVAVVAVPVALVVVQAMQSFTKAPQPSAGSNEPTSDDYSSYVP